MREKLLFLASIACLLGSADHALFVQQSIAETYTLASNVQYFQANLQSNNKHAVAPQRRVLVQLARKKEENLSVKTNQTHYRQRANMESYRLKVTGSNVASGRLQVEGYKLQDTEFNGNNVQPATFNVEQFLKQPTSNPAPAPIHPAVDKPDIAIHHRLIADEVLKLLPEKCQNSLRHFYVKSIDGRALGGKSTIIINGDPFTKNTMAANQEFRALFVHELGHVLDLGCFTGSADSGSTDYMDGDEIMYANDASISFYGISWLSSHAQKTGVHETDFVSGYASWDMFEDFAESFAYYVLHRGEFAERAAQNSALAAKYRWFQTYIPNVPAAAISHHNDSHTIPWDITKLSYTWTANTLLTP